MLENHSTRKKMQLKKIHAGLFALLLVAAVVAAPSALADKEDKAAKKLDRAEKKDQIKELKKELKRPQARQGPVAVTVGVGAAVDSDGNLHRSHYRIGLENATDTGSYQVKNGQIFILEKGRGNYKLVPETWKIDIRDGAASFNATGQAKGSNGTYDVSLAGTKIRDVANGAIYQVSGKLVGDGSEYDLHYISTMSKSRSVDSSNED